MLVRCLESTHAGRNQDPEGGNDGSKQVPGRSEDHEEFTPSSSRDAVRRLFHGRTDLHRHGADEQGKPFAVSAHRPRKYPNREHTT